MAIEVRKPVLATTVQDLGRPGYYDVGIPLSGTSVNPARSTAVAFFNGAEAPMQLWLFWVAPIIGAVIAGATYAAITGERRGCADIEGELVHD